MLHPHTRLQFINDNIGYGVFATGFIPAGTITYVKDALEIELTSESEIVASPAYSDYIKKYAYPKMYWSKIFILPMATRIFTESLRYTIKKYGSLEIHVTK